jgi:hypothetical protein
LSSFLHFFFLYVERERERAFERDFEREGNQFISKAHNPVLFFSPKALDCAYGSGSKTI